MNSYLSHSKNILKRSLQYLASHLGPQRLSTNSTAKLWSLMYHRVLPTTDPRAEGEEPGMIITPSTFRQHIQILKTLFEIMPLSEWIERHNSGAPLPKRACAITFDDGWLDNFEYAFPILQQEQVPATLFAVSHMIGTHGQFWPNRVARLIANRADWQQQPALEWIRRAGGESAHGMTDREKLGHIIARLKKLSDAELKERLDTSEQQLGLAAPATPALVDWEQLRAMQNSGLVEIGSHTCHHFRLTADLKPDIAEQEIVQSKQLLEQQLERPVKLFCYPNGDASPHAIRLVEQHYAAAVTTQRGINSTHTAPHQLLRIGVHEYVSDTPTKFKARLSGWI
jgi:peptidoglycan/xylan/chitin deacetylase (PgdA/CDA1 family)